MARVLVSDPEMMGHEPYPCARCYHTHLGRSVTLHAGNQSPRLLSRSDLSLPTNLITRIAPELVVALVLHLNCLAKSR